MWIKVHTSLIYFDKIKRKHFHTTKSITDDLCAINDGGEFEKSICEIFPEELRHKVEHQGDHATFLNLEITIM